MDKCNQRLLNDIIYFRMSRTKHHLDDADHSWRNKLQELSGRDEVSAGGGVRKRHRRR